MTAAAILPALPIVAIALPLAMALACANGRLRALLSSLFWLAPVPALAAALLAVGAPAWELHWSPYRLTFVLDAPGAMLLGTSALLWIAAGISAPTFLRGKPDSGRFTVCWFLTLTGSMGIFVAADLASFLVAYALVSLPAYGMILHDGSASARRAGGIYMGFALLGENLLLLAFVLLSLNAPGDSLRISDVVAAIQTAPFRDLILALLIVGFGMKMALLPMHFWMPLAYTAAPIPAAAVLSGAAVKAGVVGMLRFLPFDAGLPDWGMALVILGLTGAFFGVAVGVTQSNPKSVLAYSSVSQMGFLAMLLGVGLGTSASGIGTVVGFYAAHHVLVKGALFLAIGVAGATGARHFPRVVLFPAALIAVGLAGLPLTGGALAKLVAKGPLVNGLVGLLASLSAAGSTLLMLYFLRCLAQEADRTSERVASARILYPWLGMVVATLVVPWGFYLCGGIGSLSEAIAPDALWKLLWPILVGGLLALVLRKWGQGLPTIPNGDVASFGGIVSQVSVVLAERCETADRRLRRWPVACLSILVVAILLVATLWVSN